MTDFELAMKVGTAIIVMFGFTFGVFWKIIQEVKKSAHSRIARVELSFNDMELLL